MATENLFDCDSNISHTICINDWINGRVEMRGTNCEGIVCMQHLLITKEISVIRDCNSKVEDGDWHPADDGGSND